MKRRRAPVQDISEPGAVRELEQVPVYGSDEPLREVGAYRDNPRRAPPIPAVPWHLRHATPWRCKAIFWTWAAICWVALAWAFGDRLWWVILLEQAAATAPMATLMCWVEIRRDEAERAGLVGR